MNLSESPASSGIYVNTSNPLYLDRASGTNKIKIVDEEILTISLKHSDITVNQKDIMVDRGEFAAISVNYRSTDPESFVNECESSRVNWWDAGENCYLSNFCGWDQDQHYGIPKSFIRSVGNPTSAYFSSDNEADFMCWAFHGTSSGNLQDHSDARREVFDPVYIYDDYYGIDYWHSDVECVWANSCYTLSSTGKTFWSYTLFGQRPAHMILG